MMGVAQHTNGAATMEDQATLGSGEAYEGLGLAASRNSFSDAQTDGSGEFALSRFTFVYTGSVPYP